MDKPSASGEPIIIGSSDDVDRPLLVTLEGALLRSDLEAEALVSNLRRQPWRVLTMPAVPRPRKGTAASDTSPVPIASLPYRHDLVDSLRATARTGRRVLLHSTQHPQVAREVAKHLGVFEGVLPGDAERPQAFDCLGGETDLPLLSAARRAFVVGVTAAAATRIKSAVPRVEILSTKPSAMKAAIKVMRPHQWSKNALVLVPVLLAPHLGSLTQLRNACIAAFALSLCASAGYVFNDLVDVEADRAHRTKQRRPFASGDLPMVYGPPLFLGLTAASVGLALAFLPLAFTAMLGAYFAATLLYSFFLKSKLMVDVVVLAWLYTHRILAGGIAAGVPVSAWLLAFSMFLFSSLAFAKRYVELRHSLKVRGQIKSRGYYTDDLEMVASMGPTAGFIAVLVFCLYIDSSVVAQNYRAPVVLWFAAPVLLYWTSRIWFLAHRGHMQDDPVKFALADSRSWICGIALVGVVGLARFWPF